MYMLQFKGSPISELNCKYLTLMLHLTTFNMYGVAGLLRVSPHVETISIELEYTLVNFLELISSFYVSSSGWSVCHIECDLHLVLIIFFCLQIDDFLVNDNSCCNPELLDLAKEDNMDLLSWVSSVETTSRKLRLSSPQMRAGKIMSKRALKRFPNFQNFCYWMHRFLRISLSYQREEGARHVQWTVYPNIYLYWPINC